MPNRLELLAQKRNRLDKLIDTAKNAGRYEEMSHLNRIRHRINGTLTLSLPRRASSST
jgi:hypothetical protein